MLNSRALSIILIMGTALFGADLWWVILPLQALIFIIFASDYSEIFKSIHECPYPRGLMLPWAGLVMLMSVSAVFSVNPAASLRFLSFILAVSACFVIASRAGLTREGAAILRWVMIMTVNLEVITAVLQKSGLLPHGHWVPSVFPAGTLFNHNHFAGLIEITLPLVICFLFYKDNPPSVRITLYVSMLIQFAGLLLSGSRGAWISFFIAFVYLCIIALKKLRVRKFLFLIFSLTVLSLAFFSFYQPANKRLSSFSSMEEDASAQSRFRMWKQSFLIIRDHPLLGAGPGTFSEIFPMYRPLDMHMYVNQAHNDYLGWMAETGVFSLPCILAVFFYFTSRALKSKHSANPYVIAAGTAVLSLGVHSLADYNLRIPVTALYLAVLTGISMRKRKHTEQGGIHGGTAG